MKNNKLASVSLALLAIVLGSQSPIGVQADGYGFDNLLGGGAIQNHIGGLTQAANSLTESPLNLVSGAPGLINSAASLATRPLTNAIGALTGVRGSTAETELGKGLSVPLTTLQGIVTGAASAAASGLGTSGSGAVPGFAGGPGAALANGGSSWFPSTPGVAAAVPAARASLGLGGYRGMPLTSGIGPFSRAANAVAGLEPAYPDAVAPRVIAPQWPRQPLIEPGTVVAPATPVAAPVITGTALAPAPTAVAPAGSENAVTGAVANQLIGRQNLANDAVLNAQTEAAIAGADMVAHGANNARSASLASNAYRQAKLAGARDRVNVAGTIQNSARISDAAIATHDSATKAEDSLLGSELAVDSAATVLDSDAAHIPAVTSSLLRSLPYGRLGIRNIVPKPLTYPSVLLPDVWLNGQPVNYLNAPLRMLPYGLASTAHSNQLQASGQILANGHVINGQPFYSNNGLPISTLYSDPTAAYTAHMNGVLGSSILPVLANGQLEAQDEIAAAHGITLTQVNGAGMMATYNGYSKLNPVPMLTGSVSDGNLAPTTTIGTTYPIGSALVVEPRDSYFQDYIDNASSRQNFDERHQ